MVWQRMRKTQSTQRNGYSNSSKELSSKFSRKTQSIKPMHRLKAKKKSMTLMDDTFTYTLIITCENDHWEYDNDYDSAWETKWNERMTTEYDNKIWHWNGLWHLILYMHMTSLRTGSWSSTDRAEQNSAAEFQSCGVAAAFSSYYGNRATLAIEMATAQIRWAKPVWNSAAVVDDSARSEFKRLHLMSRHVAQVCPHSTWTAARTLDEALNKW